MSIDLTRISNIVFDGIDHNDYPKYTDAFIDSADYMEEDGTIRKLDEYELDYIQEHETMFLYDKLMDYLN